MFKYNINILFLCIFIPQVIIAKIFPLIIPITHNDIIQKNTINHIQNYYPTINDPLLNFYLKNLGDYLIGCSKNPYINNIQYLLINSSNINAFATSTNIIAINTGLIKQSVSEGELAGVIAHEIAHITQKHSQRLKEKMQYANIASYVGLLGASIMGMLSRDPNNINAPIITGQALSIHKINSHQREYEHEADRIGAQIINNSRYSTREMANQFSRLNKQTGYYNYFEENQSHPVASKRYADALYRVSSIKKKKSLLRDSEFQLIKTYIQFKEKDIYKLLNSHFGKILLLILENKISLATKKIRDMYKENPNSFIISYIYIKLLIISKEYDKALIIINETNNLFENNYPIMILHSKIYILNNQYVDAKRLLKEISLAHPKAPDAFYLYSKVAFKTNKPILGHMMMGYYFFNISQIQSSIEQFKIALQKIKKSDHRYDSLYNIYDRLVKTAKK